MKTYVREIDGLRAIAVAAVIVFHAFPTALPGGFIGVDVFFVISGFIITKTYFDDLAQNRVSLGRFFMKRVRRLAPIYIAVLLTTTIAAYLILIPIHLKHFAESLVAQPFYLQNIVFWHHGDYFEHALSKPLLHTWSLAVEEQFYLTYGLLILIVRRMPRAAVLLTVLATAVSVVLAYKVSGVSPKTSFYWLPTRLWQLALGVLGAMAASRTARRPWPYVQYVALALIIWAIVGFDEHAAFPGAQSIAACGGAVLALASVSTSGAAPGLGPVLANPVMIQTGKLSYSLYLWHWPIIALAASHVERSLRPTEALGAVLATVAISYVGYEYVEKPVRKGARLPSDRKLLGAAALSGVVTAGVAFAFIATDGATFRYPREIAGLYLAQQQRSPFRCPVLTRFTDPTSEVCKINAVASGTNVLVLGDSHADQLDEMIAELAAREGIGAFLTKRDCKVHDLGAREDCNAAVFQQIQRDIETHQIKYVLSISFYTRAFTETEAKQLEVATNKLLESVDRVFLMQAVPNDVFFNPAERAGALRKNGALARQYTIDDYKTDNALQLESLRRIAASNPRITVLDPSRYICPQLGCDFDTHGVPNYFDSQHMSPTGAKRLAPMFADVLRSLPRK